jgi:CheY-like chemotaxis protein
MFSVEMPMGPDRVPAAMQAVPVLEPAAAPLKGMVLLCIDNEPAILDGMRMLLSGWGCQVITAPSLTGAFESLKPAADAPFKRPHIIIADYHLDRGTGIEAIVALRWKLGQDIPAVLLTADRSPGVREEAGEKQIHVMNKPLKPAALRSFLAQTRASQPAT